MKIFTVIGARPQFVKAAALSRVFKQHADIEEIVVHTGQHFDYNMSKVFFDEMKIKKPSINLDINGVSHGKMTGRMIEKLEEQMMLIQPDVVLLYGDTNSTLAGSIAASKLGIKVAHVEAGLRSFNMNMPEEINRILTDRVSSFLFCPTTVAENNLKREGYNHLDVNVEVVGDVMYDAALHYQSEIEVGDVSKWNLEKEYILCTLHRAENTDTEIKLRTIVDTLNALHKNVKQIVMPLHPRTKQKLIEYGLTLDVMTIDPVGYFDMIRLMNNSTLIMTDSGGVQKEAYFFKKKCITLRSETEWTELVDEGVNVLTEIDQSQIENKVKDMLGKVVSFDNELYGTGNAAFKICEILRKNIN